VIENNDKKIFGKRKVHNYEKGEESKVGIVCCDVEGIRTVLALMSGELISHEGLGSSIKSEVVKSEATKLRAMQRHLPN